MKTGHDRRPEWLKVRLPAGDTWRRVKGIVEGHRLDTVCMEARCPNLAECWGAGTATFMILGNSCTRACRFCAVTPGTPGKADLDEPRRVASATAQMGLRHAVITSVTRDDLPDGGASLFAATVEAIRRAAPGCTIELLIPDFQGDMAALKTVCDARPDILGHNVETVPRLYDVVRGNADYRRSLLVIERTHEAGLVAKSGMMLGIGERDDEVTGALADLREHHCDVVTIGQYLQPTRDHLPVDRYVTPQDFKRFRDEALRMGFSHVESGPLVRSSYHAERAMVSPSEEGR